MFDFIYKPPNDSILIDCNIDFEFCGKIYKINKRPERLRRVEGESSSDSPIIPTKGNEVYRNDIPLQYIVE